MRRIDGLDLQHPSTGARLLRDMLRQGHTVRRKHIATPMKGKGIESLYHKPNLSRWHPAHAVYPYLSCNLSFTRANHDWVRDITHLLMRHFCPHGNKIHGEQ